MNILIVGVVLAAMLLLYASVNERFKTMEKQMAAMRKTIDALRKGGPVEDPKVDAELRELLAQGKDVQAVKLAREYLGLSLLDAKNYVDSLKM
ncbi:hypothetical protein BN1080_01349 [Planococcus massiliensis]|uniref:Ribosomal protein L7/L12 C-terminal domain-containing protein n=1 Tax=Planococcus massiliensis TaxID=1499687 RepID=A0A098EMA8_9BACL|nr:MULTISPECIES: hypothetical protein [Planococcus]MCJ1907187.1 hypothetical protein [Planococcus ruber]CEG22421.1 hypothetical protein BN1080_01349 [Planococcus massiliensis]